MGYAHYVQGQLDGRWAVWLAHLEEENPLPPLLYYDTQGEALVVAHDMEHNFSTAGGVVRLLPEEPPLVEGWVNVYKDAAGVIHPTREKALRHAGVLGMRTVFVREVRGETETETD